MSLRVSRFSSIIMIALLLLMLISYCSVSVAFVIQTTTKPSSITITTQLQATKSALILQNKGGGHGELGYQLAKVLSEKMDSITIVQDNACNKEKEPFKSYSTDLPSNVNVIYAPLTTNDDADDETISDVSRFQSTILQGKSYNYIWDNISKGPTGIGKTIIDCASIWNDDKKDEEFHFLCYISSAGIYKPTTDHGRNPLDETITPIKETAGQHLYNLYATNEKKVPFVSFRPQYIYGPKSNKFDYLDYFFDRLVRKLPVPIPGDGNQLVSLTNSQDVATLLASPLNNENVAIQEGIFNCGTDQLISYNDLTYACAEAAGIPKFNVKIEYFDPDTLGTKGNFPFRPTDFFVTPDKVQSKLNWTGPQYTIQSDLVWYYNDCINNRNGLTKQVPNLVKDWEIVIGCKSSSPEYVGSIYDQYDPLIVSSYESSSTK